MVFTIVQMGNGSGTYEVASDTGEHMMVTSVQIFSALLSGNIFTNCHLTTKGFGVKTGNGIKYTQMKMNGETKRLLNVALAEQKRREEMLVAERRERQTEYVIL